MHNQPKYRGLRAERVFRRRLGARPLVEGTVARGTLQEDEAFFTGKVNKVDVEELPFAIDAAGLDRGQERFNIYCTPCHGRTGDGNGMVVQRGFRQPPSFHIDRLRQADVGHFFDVMTNGFGAMPDYKRADLAADRWQIVAYIRALQLSQHAAAADVPGGDPTKVRSRRRRSGRRKGSGEALTNGHTRCEHRRAGSRAAAAAGAHRRACSASPPARSAPCMNPISSSGRI